VTAIPEVPNPGPGHEPVRVLTFDTTAGPLEIHQCQCGRLFDALRMAVHLEREGR
jgi:hypothetical protein